MPDNIMDGAGTATLSPTDFAKVASGEKIEVKQTDVKSVETKVETKEPVSSAGELEDPNKAKDTKDEDKVAGLTAELARVREGRRVDQKRVEELEAKIAALETTTKKESPDFSDADLVRIKDGWSDELVDAKLDVREARRSGDPKAIHDAELREARAKGQLKLAEQEITNRQQSKGKQEDEAKAEEQELLKEIRGLYDDTLKTFPDLDNKDSELYKAAEKEFQKHPKLMKRLGAVADLTAVQMAIAKNPKLVEGVSTKDRKDLLKEIENVSETSLKKTPASAPARKGAVDYSNLPAAKMEEMIQQVINGGTA